jgi:hypothetical protein
VEHKREILKWLSKVDYKKMHTKASSLQMPGTGTWFIESNEMQAWLNEPNSFLWLHGIRMYPIPMPTPNPSNKRSLQLAPAKPS